MSHAQCQYVTLACVCLNTSSIFWRIRTRPGRGFRMTVHDRCVFDILSESKNPSSSRSSLLSRVWLNIQNSYRSKGNVPMCDGLTVGQTNSRPCDKGTVLFDRPGPIPSLHLRFWAQTAEIFLLSPSFSTTYDQRTTFPETTKHQSRPWKHQMYGTEEWIRAKTLVMKSPGRPPSTKRWARQIIRTLWTTSPRPSLMRWPLSQVLGRTSPLNTLFSPFHFWVLSEMKRAAFWTFTFGWMNPHHMYVESNFIALVDHQKFHNV